MIPISHSMPNFPASITMPEERLFLNNSVPLSTLFIYLFQPIYRGWFEWGPDEKKNNNTRQTKTKKW